MPHTYLISHDFHFDKYSNRFIKIIFTNIQTKEVFWLHLTNNNFVSWFREKFYRLENDHSHAFACYKNDYENRQLISLSLYKDYLTLSSEFESFTKEMIWNFVFYNVILPNSSNKISEAPDLLQGL